MSELTGVLAAGLRGGEPLVLATVAAVRGSAPRATGARMLVGAARTWGTVGGGSLEHRCLAEARSMLAAGPQLRLARFDPDSGIDQACAGVVDVLFERLGAADVGRAESLERLHAAGALVRVVGMEGTASGRWLLVSAQDVEGSLGAPALDAAAREASRALLAHDQPRCTIERLAVGPDGETAPFLLDPLHGPAFDILLFGAGHVGRALVDVLGRVDCRIVWVDSRSGVFPEAVPPNVRVQWADPPELELDRAPEGAFVLVMTHGHDGDFRIVERALARDDLAYVGMIGSLPKRNRLRQWLQQRADSTPPRAAARVAASRLDRLVCPIGVAGIRGKEPSTIAIAVAAQLLQVRDARAVADPEPAPAATSAPGGPG